MVSRNAANPSTKRSAAWDAHDRAISSCTLCPHLRKHCLKTAKEKRKSFNDQDYYGLPVPAFGDVNAKLVLIGLAPAAHGANRTGRMFTGDRSGDWLYRALHKAGFANQPQSVSSDDGLKLKNAIVTATARCAPPQNKPTPGEIRNCAPFLEWELDHLNSAKAFLGLGKIGFDATAKILKARGFHPKCAVKFSHGTHVEFTAESRIVHLVGSYHPSQQNTFTGRLTEPMFDAVFEKCKDLCGL